jgi:hypothetical protein
VTSKMFKDEKKRGNNQKKFAFIARTYARFWRFGVHNSMNVESVIEKLQRIAMEKEA